jgi:hypothetical protein
MDPMHPHTPTRRSVQQPRPSALPILRLGIAAAVLGIVMPGVTGGAEPWSVSTSLAVRATYDSNVLLQDIGDQAGRESWVSSLMPGIAIGYQKGPAFKLAATYAPEIVTYHSEASEDHISHRGSLQFSGVAGDSAWEQRNSVLWINGDKLGPRFTGGGDIPAIGGIPLRDRRDSAVYRNSIKLTRTFGATFLRPHASSYVHDFRTEKHQGSEPGFAGYENYVDRREIAVGIDGGYALTDKTWLVLSYRLGRQKQKKNQFLAASPYSNNFHRFLAGIEGAPADWLRVNILAGPDVRDFCSATRPGFDSGEILWFVDASITILPTARDSITIAARRFAQPAFSSHCIYQDIVYDVSYRRQITDRFAAAANFRIYIGDWQAPVAREDWVYTPGASLSYTHNPNLSAELAWSYDWVDSKVPNTAGREFTRHLISLGLKYTF